MFKLTKLTQKSFLNLFYSIIEVFQCRLKYASKCLNPLWVFNPVVEGVPPHFHRPPPRAPTYSQALNIQGLPPGAATISL